MAITILETERLILRPFEETDFEAVHAYASVAENVQYMPWGPNDESQTKAFIMRSIAQSRGNPCKEYHYAVVLKSSKKLSADVIYLFREMLKLRLAGFYT